MTAPAFTPERAAWIRANAWNDDLREMDDSYPDGRGCFIFHMSPCELGVCVPCSTGRCDQCLTTQHDGRPINWMAATVALDGVVVARLYPVDGQRCAGWWCPCDHPAPTRPAGVAAGPSRSTRRQAAHPPGRRTLGPPPVGQLDIFAIGVGT